MKIMENIISNGQITSGEIQKMFEISRQAAHKEIIKLTEINLIEQKGAGKAIYYVIKQVDARVDGKVDARLLEET